MSALVTLELGARELRATQVVKDRFTSHMEIVIPEGLYQEGFLSPDFPAFLRETLAEAEIGVGETRVGVWDAGIAVRDFRLPLMPAAELADAVAYEGKRQIPIDPSTVYYAWHCRREPTGFLIYLVAARRDMIDSLITRLGEAGLRVSRIDLKAMTLARGAGCADGLILDWGAGEATLVLMADGRPRFFRTFLLDAPEGRLEIQFEELVLSLNALIKFVRSAETQLTIGPSTPIYLAGRFAFLPGAEERAREQFPFDVRWPSPKACWPEGFPWQAHLGSLGLLVPADWRPRLTAPQAGDVRVAA